MFKIVDLWIDLYRAKETQARGLSMENPPSGNDLGLSCEVTKDSSGFYFLGIFEGNKELVLSLCLTERQLAQLVIESEMAI